MESTSIVDRYANEQRDNTRRTISGSGGRSGCEDGFFTNDDRKARSCSRSSLITFSSSN